MTIQFDDRTAEYAFDMLSELEPAYAMTVHKSQGSEYRAVILSLCGGPQMLLTRSVLYTAITRARELLIIVGNEETVAAMTRNGPPPAALFRSKAPAGGQGMSVLSWLLDLLYPPNACSAGSS